jgi:diguanylate cyclase (GGDEF)-like protein
VTTSLGINPLLQAVEHIKRDQELPITGAHEFRYLAGTYNNMYTAYKKSINNLSFKASHDELTGVYNRAGYELIKKSVDLNSTAFLLIDADRFKNVNDLYGHEAGDRMLQKIASTLEQNFRVDDYVCRIGGDQFIVLMVHVQPSVQRLIENKVKQINLDLAEVQDGLPPISVSVGVSLCGQTDNQQDRFNEADVALYYLKEHGRNGCCFYKPGMREHESCPVYEQ